MQKIRFSGPSGCHVPNGTRAHIIDSVNRETNIHFDLIPPSISRKPRIIQKNFSFKQEPLGNGVTVFTRRSDDFTLKTSRIEIIVLPSEMTDWSLIRDRWRSWCNDPAIQRHIIAHGLYLVRAC